MITQEEYVRDLRAHGLPFDDEARRQWQLLVSDERRRVAQAAAAQAERENPPPAFTFDRYDMSERRGLAALDAAADPRRAAVKAAKRAQIEAQVKGLVEQRDALQRQINALDAEWREHL